MTDTERQAHTTLAFSYLAYFLVSMAGLFLDSFLNIDVGFVQALPLAILCFGIGPLLILWAQYTSRKFKHTGVTGHFHQGPYKFLRNPTHLGLLILVTGYALISQSVIFFAVTLIGYIVSNMFFKKYERILDTHHTEVFQDYKKNVTRVF